MVIGKFWKKPCEKCDNLFARWKFELSVETGEFPTGKDVDLVEQMTYIDRDLGIPMFQCPNCGFGGCYNPSTYGVLINNEHLVEAPRTALDGRVGRDLGKLYETVVGKVGVDIQTKIAYLKTTY